VLTTVKLVARVATAEPGAEFKLYQLDDSTGVHEVRDYKIDEDGGEEINAGDYVAVYGGVKMAKNEKLGIFMNAFRIVKLDVKDQQDHYSSHLAEVVNSALRHQKGHVGGAEAGISVGGAGDGGKTTNSSMQLTKLDGNSTGNAEYDRVLAVVKANDTEAGASMHDDFGHLNMASDGIKAALSWLSDEGHIYSTIDDDHFKTT